jgi:Dolichyl-phosphate-mannose-protein mannosyltransferase
LTVVFASVAAIALLVRCASIAEPLGIDQSLWASAVRGMSRGQRLYADVWEQRPPGIYWIYLTGFRIFGWTTATVAWLDVLAAAATTVLLFDIGRRLDNARTGALAACLYAVLTMPAWLYRYGGFLERSVCETFIAVAVAFCGWWGVRFVERSTTLRAGFVGVCAGAAIVLKPNAALYFPAVIAWIILYADIRRLPRHILVREGTAALAGAAVVPVLAILWLWQNGVLHAAKVAVIDFNRFYVAEGFSPAAYAVDFSKAIWLRIKTDPLWLGGSMASLFAVWHLTRTRRLPPVAGLAMLWGAASTVVIVVNGARLFNSYFIQAFPPLALMLAWFLVSGVRADRVRRVAVVATIVLMIAIAARRHYVSKVVGSAVEDLQALRGRISQQAYLDAFGGYENRRGYSARANQELADYVRDHTGPDDRIFLFGINGAGVYFLADRLTAHRFLRVNFFVETYFPDPEFRLAAVTRELAERRPVYLIFERLNSSSEMGRTVDALQENPLVRDLLRGYRRETQIEDFTLYRRLE